MTFANSAARRIFEEGDSLKLFQAGGAQHLAANNAHVDFVSKPFEPEELWRVLLRWTLPPVVAAAGI